MAGAAQERGSAGKVKAEESRKPVKRDSDMKLNAMVRRVSREKVFHHEFWGQKGEEPRKPVKRDSDMKLNAMVRRASREKVFHQ